MEAASGGHRGGKGKEAKKTDRLRARLCISYLFNNLLPGLGREKVRSACYPILSYLQEGERAAKTSEIIRDLDKAYKLKIMLSLRAGGDGRWEIIFIL